MRNYELIYVLKPNLEEEAKTIVLDKIKGIIESSGEVVKVDTWGTRKLAYPIEKITEGYYVLINFKSTTEVPKEIDRNLKIMENAIRHMIIKLDDK
mgnify:FL=1